MTASRFCIFTICSNNYMPMARAFIDSARSFHPEADMVVCLVDERLPSTDIYDIEVEIITVDTLAIPHFRSFAFRYDVMELNTAAKPFMFLYLIEERGYETVLYFDPDIEIYAPLEAALGPLQHGASLVLTPHVLQPAEGADEPNDLSFLRAGVYNLGFLGARASEETRTILHWWSRWLLFNCVNSQPTGLFVDQKFMDLVPALGADVVILRDPGLNVAYWNLTQRRLERAGARWMVNGRPLVFFHFSGFNVDTPTRLSKYTRRFDRDLEPPLGELLHAYAERLLSLGHGRIPQGAYAFARFASGTPIPEVVRRMFRQRHAGWPSDPFATFEAQLHRPSPHVPQTSSTIVVTNLLAYLHETTTRLQHDVGLAEEEGRLRLVDWFVKHAMREMQLDARIVEPVAQRFGQAIPLAATKNGVRRDKIDLSVLPRPDQDLDVHSDAELVGRLVWRSLEATGLPIRDRWTKTGLSTPPPPGLAVRQIRLSSASGRPARSDEEAGQADYAIAMLACDISDLPQTERAALDQADELWAPSRYLQLKLAQRVFKPVLYMPLAYPPVEQSDRRRIDFALPSDRFLFIQVVDGVFASRRADVSGLIEAFRRAFPADQPSRPGIVICVTGGHHAPDIAEALQGAVGEDDGVFVVAEELPRPHVAALISLCDAAVSLHRVEGVGAFVATAMLLGRPVIATDYSATTDLVTPATGFPVDYRLAPVASAASCPEPQEIWAEPDLDHAAWLMRRLAAHPEDAEPYVARGYDLLRRNHSLEHVAARHLARLREINVDV